VGIVGWILLVKGLVLFLFAGGVTRTLLAAHPVTFDHAKRVHLARGNSRRGYA
jgi:hypothetical protein